MIKIFNTLTKEKQEFKPIDSNKIGIYVCGMTVYDYCHIGHARVMVAFDIITRHLKRKYANVVYVRNITDIDDKIINRIIETKQDLTTFTNFFIDAMHNDENSLNIIPPDIEPKATEHIDSMLYLVQKLIDKKLAYQAQNGDIYFSVRHFKNYGQLSGKNLDDLQAGNRVNIDTNKKDPLDFVLWKTAKINEPSWNAKWGAGRPGWHLECSAMSEHYLGNVFDIHGGGADLIFPHHENELAQSQGANNNQFVNYWMHVGFVNINEEKMSKSLNNFTTIKDAIKHYSGEILRYFIISSHYRSPLNYSEDNLISAENSLTRLYTGIRGLFINYGAMNEVALRYDFELRFNNALDDDFNTPVAISVLFDLLKELNSAKKQDLELAKSLAQLLRKLGGYLGLLQNEAVFFKQGIKLSDEVIEKKIKQRDQARVQKNFALADKIRNELVEHGIILEDSKNSTIWRKK